MKQIFTIVTALLLTASVFLPQQAGAQSPQRMSYQAVIRNSSEALIVDTEIGMKISILQGSASGTGVYVEVQTPTTNANGLVSLEIGAGTVINGDLSVIDWANGPYYIKTETDPDGGTVYTITGTSELLSVPYALYANEVDPSVPQGTSPGEMQYWNGTEWVIIATGNEGDIMTFVNNTPTWVGETSFGTIENPTTGRIWMDMNLGASQVATSSTDEDAYGDLYQWGRGTDGHEKRTSGTTPNLSNSDTPGHGDFIVIPATTPPVDWRSPQNNDLWQGVNGVNNPCPSGYRLPTVAEWDAERESWSSNDADGAFAALKMPLTGVRYSIGGLSSIGTLGHYWSSTIEGTAARYMGVSIYGAEMYFDGRAYGMSVRCIKE